MAAKLEEAVTALLGAVELLTSVNPTPQGAREALAKARAALEPEAAEGAAEGAEKPADEGAAAADTKVPPPAGEVAPKKK